MKCPYSQCSEKTSQSETLFASDMLVVITHVCVKQPLQEHTQLLLTNTHLK